MRASANPSSDARSEVRKPPRTIGLVQINNSFSGQNYLPYSVGLLEAFANRYAPDPNRYKFLTPIYRRLPIGDTVGRLGGAHVVGFSTYVWNGRISLEIAKRLKERDPYVLIIFGGPHVPNKAEVFLRENPFIDIVVHNEGEQTFLDVLESRDKTDWMQVSGISFIDASGQFIRTGLRARFRDLDDIPSPFLDGTFDRLMVENPDENWIGLWETNRGCPFTCAFCDWGSATAAKVSKFGLDRLKAEADWFANSKVEYIFCCDANFGIQKRDVEIAEYVAAGKKRTGYPQALSVQNTKNATERAYLTQKILSDAGLNKGVALSMQSVDMTTLKSIKRDNISLDTYMELQKRFTRDGVETYSDLILGLPGETYQSFIAGVELLIGSGQHNRIQFNNLSILPNSEMGASAYQSEHGMVTVESKIINIHGERLELGDDVAEVQELVVGTATTPPEDWLRTRSFSWMAAFLHFDKLFQIPLIIAHELTGVRYIDVFDGFLNAPKADYPVIGEISQLFHSEAKSIQGGGAEYVYSADWLGIYWPADEYAFIKLVSEEKVDAFYDEALRLLLSLIPAESLDASRHIIAEAVTLNRKLVKCPNQTGKLEVPTTHNIWAVFQSVRRGQEAAIIEQPQSIHIDRSKEYYDDFQRWCREVVWWGNKKGAYLYGNAKSNLELAGHY